MDNRDSNVRNNGGYNPYNQNGDQRHHIGDDGTLNSRFRQGGQGYARPAQPAQPRPASQPQQPYAQPQQSHTQQSHTQQSQYAQPAAPARHHEPEYSNDFYGDDGDDNNNGGRRGPDIDHKATRRARMLMLALIGCIVLLVLGIGAFFVYNSSRNAEMEQMQQLRAQDSLTMAQMELANEYAAINQEFARYENQTQLIDDAQLAENYAAAKSQIEKLLQELKNEKSKSAAQIDKLKAEIATLKGILRTYVERIDELQKENAALRDENAEMKNQNQQLAQENATVRQSNQQYQQRMERAEKLNVTGVSLTALNAKGKTEKKISKAKQLMITFTIPQNVSTPEGVKTIYARITTPEGTVLPGGPSFSFEGASLASSASKKIEWTGAEMSGVTIYWNVTTALGKGTYRVELFCDNYRLCSVTHEFSK